ncbi:glycoside hydrolase family protein [Zobellia galactanivorans]|uniref:glycoside hydrolase family protein n=1 Tax=Zobellia galactanivorans (strain DSM 12802 / CCUG 47099 / CIP 106680 / NCIMB 13871 / Dsij) TaxID=63186 RepID=UPI0026E20BE5|nr:glycoside hydrolase family protein [Zobellia galactanivorans]MDO6809670.1 glycoside hydrolase family protein [Zobellia galactanivorans]
MGSAIVGAKTVYHVLLLTILVGLYGEAQDVKRLRPAEWEGVVYGGRFMDRFLPLPKEGELTSNTWGQEMVKPRYLDNGIEDATWSYWGGNIHRDLTGKYNLFVCRWLEDNPMGHMAWPTSEVVRAVSDKPHGPYRVVQVIGPGHNPEMQQLKDGRYFLNVNHSYYLSEKLEGPWKKFPFTFDARNRHIDAHIANNTFAKREDGSMLMVSRGGGIWISETGLPPYHQITSQSVYPPYKGKYEDPVVWRTHIQYHLIVNDWQGRIAYYLRSKDGIHWKLDAGEAYVPGIARHKDGRIEGWYKFERIKVLQDEYGRAYQANFAVSDTIKRQDFGNDNHSSKNICIPLTVGKLIELVNQDEIGPDTEKIQLLIKAEPGFDPHKDIHIKSLRFGAPEVVDYGQGCRVLKTEKVGSGLLVTFTGKGNGISDYNFVAKLLGKTKKGELLFGYARLPWITYIEPMLSSKFPELSLNGEKLKANIEIENFGQVASQTVDLLIEYLDQNEWKMFSKETMGPLQPYEKKNMTLWGIKIGKRNESVQLRISIKEKERLLDVLEGPVIVR